MKFLENIKNKFCKKDIKSNNMEKDEVLKREEDKKIKIEKNMIIKLILLAIISVIIAVVFELFIYKDILKVWQNSVGYYFSHISTINYTLPFSYIRLFLFMGIVFFIGLHFIIKPRKIYEFICDKRYIIALIFLVIVTVLGINGGSLSRVNYYLGVSDGDELVEEFGISRDIRSDEWGTQSLYILSQTYDDYSTISNTLRGTDTDMFTLVNSPVKSPLMLGRPFLIMFLILDNLSSAYAFYWFARITLMCLATYEIMRILTDDKKLLSFVGMILVSFSAATQWWYCLDVLIWGEVILSLFNLFFKTDKKSTKILCGIGEIIGVLSYIFVLYPAWQVSFAYIFIPVLVLILYKNIKQGNMKKIDVIDVTIICVAVLMIVLSLALWLITSIDTINAISSTVYPGERIGTGGVDKSLFAYFYNWFMPYECFKTNISSNNYFENGIETYSNQCENATMLSLYPIPMILALVYIIKNKDKDGKKDIFLIVSTIVSVILSIYVIIGFPEFLSKISLLYLSIGKRAAIPLACLNVYMFIYLVSKVIDDDNIKLIENKFICVILSTLLLVICLLGDGNNYLRVWEIILSAILFFIMFNLSFKINNKKCRNILLIMMAVITLIGGLTVNPIVYSVDSIEDYKDLSEAIQKYVANDPDAIWVGNILSFVESNYMAANGANTLSSTNVYPNEELYRTLFGDDEEMEKIWNRYHHLEIIISDIETTLALKSNDMVILNLNYKDLNKLGVKYILTAVNLDIECEYMNLNLLEVVDGKFLIYEVLEQDAIGHIDEKIEKYHEALPNAVWLADEISEEEMDILLYHNDIDTVTYKIDLTVTNDKLEEDNIRYILTKKNLGIEFPELSVRERQVIGEYIIYEVIEVEG